MVCFINNDNNNNIVTSKNFEKYIYEYFHNENQFTTDYIYHIMNKINMNTIELDNIIKIYKDYLSTIKLYNLNIEKLFQKTDFIIDICTNISYSVKYKILKILYTDILLKDSVINQIVEFLLQNNMKQFNQIIKYIYNNFNNNIKHFSLIICNNCIYYYIKTRPFVNERYKHIFAINNLLDFKILLKKRNFKLYTLCHDYLDEYISSCFIYFVNTSKNILDIHSMFTSDNVNIIAVLSIQNINTIVNLLIKMNEDDKDNMYIVYLIDIFVICFNYTNSIQFKPFIETIKNPDVLNKIVLDMHNKILEKFSVNTVSNIRNTIFFFNNYDIISQLLNIYIEYLKKRFYYYFSTYNREQFEKHLFMEEDIIMNTGKLYIVNNIYLINIFTDMKTTLENYNNNIFITSRIWLLKETKEYDRNYIDSFLNNIINDINGQYKTNNREKELVYNLEYGYIQIEFNNIDVNLKPIEYIILKHIEKNKKVNYSDLVKIKMFNVYNIEQYVNNLYDYGLIDSTSANVLVLKK